MRISAQNLRDNPLIGAYHFYRRFTLFREIVLSAKFNLSNYWDRYEWQGRGSPHNHGVYWVDGAAPADMATPESRAAFEAFWGIHVTAVNPTPGAPRSVANPLMAVPFRDIQPTFGFLADVLNRVQQHACGPAYCLRRKKKGRRPPPAVPAGLPGAGEAVGGQDALSCRFYYPREVHDGPHVGRNLNPAHFMYDGQRNNTRLNNYNRTVTVGWQANTDVAPCTDLHAVLGYIAKYCSKAETKTEPYEALARTLLPRVSQRAPLLSFVSRLMNKLISERDWTAQEVCHHLLNLPLVEASRVVLDVDCRHPERQRGRSAVVNEDGIREFSSVYEKYVARGAVWEEYSYFDVLTRVNTRRTPWREFPRAEPRVLNYFPRYKPNEAQLEDFARVKLMLHHPHRSLEELKTVEGTEFDSFAAAYDHCCDVHPGLHPRDYYGELPPPPEDEFEEQPNQEDDIVPGDWEELAGQLPRRGLETEDLDVLGNRDVDLLYDWNPHVGRYPDLARDTGYWKRIRESSSLTLEVEDVSDSAVDLLSPEQRLLYDTVFNHFLSGLDDGPPPQLLLNVDGKGGTGKSYVINMLSAHIRRTAVARGLPEPDSLVVRAAPTGVAANAIHGTTLHSLLRLPVATGPLAPLPPSSAAELQRRLQAVRYIVIDEKSMIGLQLLANIDSRLRQAFPGASHTPFGGASLILIGDFYQLPPVMQRPLYYAGELRNVTEIAGRNAYMALDRTIQLKTVQRQRGPEEEAFRNALDGLRAGQPSVPDWELLCTRVQANLPLADVAAFDNALRLYTTNGEVNEYNFNHMVGLGTPCIQVHASNNGPKAGKVSASDAGNLHNTIPTALRWRARHVPGKPLAGGRLG